jgi:hypothetical protein
MRMGMRKTGGLTPAEPAGSRLPLALSVQNRRAHARRSPWVRKTGGLTPAARLGCAEPAGSHPPLGLGAQNRRAYARRSPWGTGTARSRNARRGTKGYHGRVNEEKMLMNTWQKSAVWFAVSSQHSPRIWQLRAIHRTALAT